MFSSNQILNVSPNLQIAIYLENWSSLPNFFSVILKSMSFNLTEANLTSKDGLDFSHSHLSFTTPYSLKSEKRLVG